MCALLTTRHSTFRKVSLVNSDAPDYRHRFAHVPPAVLQHLLQTTDTDVMIGKCSALSAQAGLCPDLSVCVTPFDGLLDACLSALYPQWPIIEAGERSRLGAAIIARLGGRSLLSMRDDDVVDALATSFNINIASFGGLGNEARARLPGRPYIVLIKLPREASASASTSTSTSASAGPRVQAFGEAKSETWGVLHASDRDMAMTEGSHSELLHAVHASADPTEQPSRFKSLDHAMLLAACDAAGAETRVVLSTATRAGNVRGVLWRTKTRAELIAALV
jgi:hypothetical protein